MLADLSCTHVDPKKQEEAGTGGRAGGEDDHRHYRQI